MITKNSFGSGHPAEFTALKDVLYIDTKTGIRYKQVDSPGGNNWVLKDRNNFIYPSDFTTDQELIQEIADRLDGDADNLALITAETAARIAADTAINNTIAGLTTDDIAEGANLYFTDQRVLDTTVTGSNPQYQYPVDGESVLVWLSYLLGCIMTIEGYLEELIEDTVGAMMTDSGTVDFTYSDIAGTLTAIVKDASVTYAKIQNVSATDKILGRSSAGAGSVEEISCTSGARTMIAKVAPYGVFNTAVAPVTGFSSDTYLVGSSCAIPNNSLQAKSTYRCIFNVTKTGAGTATPIINIRFGTNGSTSDTSRGTLTWSAQTAVADEGVFEVWVTFNTVGSGTLAVIQSLGRLTHRLSVTGLGTGVSEPEIATSGGFDSTVSNSIIGISVNGGASAVWTITLVQAELKNLA